VGTAVGTAQARVENTAFWRMVPATKRAIIAREAGIFSAREEAAFAWAESLTLIAETHVPDADYDAARAVFSEQELASLTAAVATINVWNRFSVAYRFAPEID
jgi:alkylhydroperoxidase family enzyme